MKTAKPDQYLRRRLSDLEQQLKHERQQDITRAVDLKNRRDDRGADYHTGLADGRNSALAELRKLTSEYPADRLPMGING